MPIDWSRPVQTRDGRRVEIITRNGRGLYPVIGYVGDNSIPDAWTSEGLAFCRPASDDLVNVPERVERLFRCCVDAGGNIVLWNDPRSRPAGTDIGAVRITTDGGRLISAEVVEAERQEADNG